MEEEFSTETDFQIEKDHVKYNKNQQGMLLKHSQAVNFCAREFDEKFVKHLHSEYNIRSEIFGTHEMNTVRWRKNKEGVMESNAKIVQWDDGSMHLMIGDQLFNLQSKEFQGESCTAYNRSPDTNQNSYLTDQVVPQLLIQKMAIIQKTTNFS